MRKPSIYDFKSAIKVMIIKNPAYLRVKENDIIRFMTLHLIHLTFWYIPNMFMGTILTEVFSMVMFVFTLTIYKHFNASPEKNMFSFFAFLLTFALQSASAICYPFQAYRSNWTYELVSVRQNKFLIQILIFLSFFCTVHFFQKRRR